MKNINIKSSVFILIVGLMSFACGDDWLEEKPKGAVSDLQLANEAGLQEVLIGAYSLLDGNEGGAGFRSNASPHNWMWGDLPADDMHVGANSSAWGESIERFVAQTTDIDIAEAWSFNYDGVSRANDVLRILALARESGEVSGSVANQIEAEAKWLRAWYHFNLRMRHERIPYITETVIATDVANDQEVWDLIEEDVSWGITNNMAKNPSDPGRASYWAAKTLLARVHLFQQEFAEAAPLLDDVIDNGGFSLAPHFYDNFSEEEQHNVESIFEVEFSADNQGGGWPNANQAGFASMTGGEGSMCCGYQVPTFNLFNAFKVDGSGLPLLDTFDDNLLTADYGVAFDEVYVPTTQVFDPRVDWTIARRSIPMLDFGPFSGSDRMWEQATMGPFINKKAQTYLRNRDQVGQNWRPEDSNNKRIFRLGHVMLWRAEVAVELNDLPTALSLVNLIRNRASDDIQMGLVTTSDGTFGSGAVISIDDTQPAANYDLQPYASFPSQDYARKAVRFELRLETALEGMRFHDLVRWGVAEQTINAYLAKELAGGKLNWMSGTTFSAGKNEYWPIPGRQVDLQGGTLVQDPNF